jgi:hypothetical protein
MGMEHVTKHKQNNQGPGAIAGAIGCFASIVIVGFFLFQAYEGLDNSGWIPHDVETRITVGNNWLVGETRECYSLPFPKGYGVVHGRYGYAVAEIFCDAGPPHDPSHNMKVKFWGRIYQPEHSQHRALWRCTRTSDSFECKQTGAAVDISLPPAQ